MASAASHKETLLNVTALTSLPTEILQEIVKYVDEADLIALRSTARCLHAESQTFFSKAFFTDRRHVVTRKSLEVLLDIIDHEVFRNDLKSITFKLIVKLESGVEEHILSAFRTLHARDNRVKLGLAAITHGEIFDGAHFIGQILALCASIQPIHYIIVEVNDIYYLDQLWIDRVDRAISAQLATGSSLEFTWPQDGPDSNACYASEDHSLTINHMTGGNDDMETICERVGNYISNAIIKPLEILQFDRCDVDPGALLKWLKMFPEIKILSILEMDLWPDLYNGPYGYGVCDWYDILEAIMELKHVEVLIIKDNRWLSSQLGPPPPTLDRTSTERGWKLDDVEVGLNLDGKQNIHERLEREISKPMPADLDF